MGNRVVEIDDVQEAPFGNVVSCGCQNWDYMRHVDASLIKGLVGVPSCAACGWIGYSALVVPHNLRLPAAVSGERRDLASKAGRLSYYFAGDEKADPLLLIHSINAAGSAYEVRPLYEHYRKSRAVYALELPGFGFSDRSERAYTPRLMTDAVLAMVAEIQRRHGGRPIDVLALSFVV